MAYVEPRHRVVGYRKVNKESIRILIFTHKENLKFHQKKTELLGVVKKERRSIGLTISTQETRDSERGDIRD